MLAVGQYSAVAQDLGLGRGGADAPSGPPQPTQLSGDWWAWFVAEGADPAARASEAMAALAPVREQVAGTPGEYQLTRIESGLDAWVRLRQREPQSLGPLPAAVDTYTLDEVLAFDRELRAAEVMQRAETAEREARQRAVASLEQRYNTAFAAYIALPVVDRLREGLGLYADRVALAIEQERMRLLQSGVQLIEDRIGKLRALIQVAIERISVTAEEIQKAEQSLAKMQEAALDAQQALRLAEADVLAATGDSELGRAQEHLANQRVVLASIREMIAELNVAAMQARIDFRRFRMADEAEREALLPVVRENATARGRVVDRARAQRDVWIRRSESNLLPDASDGGDSEDANPELTSLIEQRIDVARDSLRALQRLDRVIGDVGFVRSLVATQIAEAQGALGSLWANTFESLGNAWDRSVGFLTYSLFSISGTPITALGILRVVLILLIAVWVSKLLRHGLDRIGAKRGTMNQSSLYSLGRLLHYTILVIATVIALSSIGLDFSNLALIAGALSVGIGFGMQSIVSNFVSGLILLFERSLNVGDFVELDSGITGVVKEISVRSTLINTNDNIDILVPNSEFINGRLINWTLREASRRIHIPFGVAYGTDKALVRKAVLEAADNVSHTLKTGNRKPQVWFVNFGDSSLDFELIVWVSQASVRRPGAISAEYLWEIETALGKYGIEVPFPQRDLHIRSGLHRDEARTNDKKEPGNQEAGK